MVMEIRMNAIWCWINILLLISTLSNGVESQRRPLLVNFGDSNSDTGGVLAGIGLPIGLPNGITFFHRGTGRLGDGRLIIDFFCKYTLYLLFCFLSSLEHQILFSDR